MKKLFQPVLTIGLLFSLACGEPTSQHEEDSTSKEDSLKEAAAAPQLEQRDKAYYPIPSPEQMFRFISDAGLEYSKSLVNNPALASEYVSPSKKALNFGVYTADLAYAAAYQDIELTLELYKVVKRLGAEMNIAEMMTSEMMDKMQANMQKPDSLEAIASDSYYQAVDYLESNEQNGKLALMSLGGWIESLYITLNSIEKVKADSPTVQRVADQKITFGNLYTYLKKNEEEAGVQEAIEDIKDIRSVFASLLEEKTASSSSSKQGNKMVFGKGSKINMNEAQFAALKKSINTYRAKITSN